MFRCVRQRGERRPVAKMGKGQARASGAEVPLAVPAKRQGRLLMTSDTVFADSQAISSRAGFHSQRVFIAYIAETFEAVPLIVRGQGNHICRSRAAPDLSVRAALASCRAK